MIRKAPDTFCPVFLHKFASAFCAKRRTGRKCKIPIAILAQVCYNLLQRGDKPRVKKVRKKMAKYYRVVKVEINTGKETNYGGGYTEEDVKAITKGYTINKEFGYYERKNGKYMFFVDED